MTNGAGAHEGLSRKAQFWWGCLGAAVTEVLRFRVFLGTLDSSKVGAFDSGQAILAGAFFVTTLLVIVFSGAWSTALKSHWELLAVYHGATASVVLSFLVH